MTRLNLLWFFLTVKWIGLLFFPCSFAFPCCWAVMLSRLTSSGQSADVRVGSEWRTDVLQSALSHGWMGCRCIRPDSEHAAMEVSLWKAWGSGVRVTESTKYIFVLLCLNPPRQKRNKNWSPFPSRTSLQNMCISLIPCPFSMSLYLSLLCGWIGSQTGLQPGSFCLSFGLWLQILFSFFGKKKIKDKEIITVPTKIISTYQESCRTSYTSFYCITVSL